MCLPKIFGRHVFLEGKFGEMGGGGLSLWLLIILLLCVTVSCDFCATLMRLSV